MEENRSDFTEEQLKTLPDLNLKTYAILVEDLAKDIESRFGIPHIVPIVQSAHESRNGNSGLARNHCNLFGIVATKSWTDKGRPICSMPTFEFISGKRVDMHRDFRAYSSWRESFEDWADIITRLSVYKTALANFKDGKIREGIQDMARSYASDPQYARSLIALYEVLSQAGV